MYRVLLADDEQIERMALARRLMRRFGDILQISEATNGKEAVQLYENYIRRNTARSLSWIFPCRN